MQNVYKVHKVYKVYKVLMRTEMEKRSRGELEQGRRIQQIPNNKLQITNKYQITNKFQITNDK
jgi:hypothetical protein